MSKSLLKALIVLPGTAGLIIPATILFLTRTGFMSASPATILFWLGLFLLATGLFFAMWTVILFSAVGQGTPAPWEPPLKLVVQGPYRYVRNPMISGMVLILFGQALLFASSALALWAIIFFIANAIYFPLVEEKGLKARFGEDYARYMANVPRWLPRLKPWNREESN